MIYIDYHIQRLEWLKEWIADRIDGKISPPIWVNLDALPFKFSIDDVLKIWRQTGLMFYKEDVISHPAIPVSFDEYCQYKQSILS
jgi:hypothetical protein